MSMKFKPIAIVGYSLFLVVTSSLITVLYYHLFVFNTFAGDNSQTQSLREVSREQVVSSPIKEDHSIIEVMSYGCHYCAANEEDLAKFSRSLPAGSVFKTIHIAGGGSGLAAYAPIFATLTEMGVEEQYRDSAYNAIIARNIDLNNENALVSWLKKNDIDVEKYQSVRQSDAVKQRIDDMADITRHYAINATPMFIINKRYVVAQDRDFPEFAQRMQKLLKKDN
ncbi:Thiol:disulfide interchange protein DsbA [Erwinia tasmaniensis Et1/99]|uniref:Thiol:disulfide interchange protein DsbA n=2 Tax=Erwinia tasmaniensis TaxID=338565 RepID=B2VCR9_ERWT9|nr:Thiol:disulfide interchange protein DsbA [Erwinia tasmaniensis Et1/99]